MEFEKGGRLAKEYVGDVVEVDPLAVVSKGGEGAFFFFQIVGVDDHKPHEESFLVLMPALAFRGGLLAVAVSVMDEKILVGKISIDYQCLFR